MEPHELITFSNPLSLYDVPAQRQPWHVGVFTFRPPEYLDHALQTECKSSVSGLCAAEPASFDGGGSSYLMEQRSNTFKV